VLDQEYQRFKYETKTLEGPRARKVVPDLILHRRHEADGNVLVIEVKTARGEGERLHDFAKLYVLTGCAEYAEDYDGSLRLPGNQLPGEQQDVRVGLASPVPWRRTSMASGCSSRRTGPTPSTGGGRTARSSASARCLNIAL